MSGLTKKAIAESLKELLLQKPMDKITVGDISDNCGINRQTFYYHFQDIPDLVEWMILQDADKAIQNNKTYATWQEGFLAVFNLIIADKSFIMNIYHTISHENVVTYVYRLVYPLIINVVNELAKGMDVRDEDKEFIANFYKYAFVGLVMDWINKGMKEDPHKIIDRLSVLIKGTIKQALENYKVN